MSLMLYIVDVIRAYDYIEIKECEVSLYFKLRVKI